MKVRTSLALAGSAAALATAGLLAGPALASSATPTHTLQFSTHSITTHNFGKTGGVALDKDTHNGKVVAYDILDFVSANGADVSLGLPDGFLYAHISFSSKGAITGKVTGGTGKYKGDAGTVAGQQGKTGANVTVKYH
ncbi:MAG TPA: hypothetical protein VHU92_24305 [Streptosporangiaceae bacterium]|nr:hypothetical protein [Streptosporangiaceae bacterium]